MPSPPDAHREKSALVTPSLGCTDSNRAANFRRVKPSPGYDGLTSLAFLSTGENAASLRVTMQCQLMLNTGKARLIHGVGREFAHSLQCDV